jgi:nitroreductase
MHHSPISEAHLLQQQNFRYATKAFDASRKIPAATWAALEETLILSPSSFGLQPWKFLVVEDAAVREKLMAVSWGQRQVVDASHFVVFAIKKNVGQKEIDAFIDRMVAVRGGTKEDLEPYRQMMIGSVVNGPIAPMVNEWAARQAYIALGNLMTSAALLGLDTCPLEGFDPSQYNEILGLDAQGLAAVVACPVGYRSPEDKYAGAPKVRFEAKDLIVKI